MDMETSKCYLRGFDHIELRVKDAYRMAKYLCKVWGFEEIAYAGPSTGRAYVESRVLRQGGVVIVLSEGIRTDSLLARLIETKGEGVQDVAFVVDDVEVAYRMAILGGAKAVAKPKRFLDDHGNVVMIHAAVATCGDVIHTLMDRRHYHDVFAPGFRAVGSPLPSGRPIGIEKIDHAVFNVHVGKMDPWTDFYTRAFGMEKLTTFDETQITTEYAALRSTVMRSPGSEVMIPINEPVEGKRSHIDDFLRSRGGAGVQHIALQTNNIITTVSMLKSRGEEFLEIPECYYQAAQQRVEGLAIDLWPLAQRGILVDRDEKGYLLQIFTKTILGEGAGFFFEIIQRHGSDGFGVNNFRELFIAIERAAGRC